MKMQVDIDTALDDITHEQWLAECAEAGVTATLIDPWGPAGGWPIYRLVGEDAALRALVLDRYQGDDEWFNTYAKEVRTTIRPVKMTGTIELDNGETVEFTFLPDRASERGDAYKALFPSGPLLGKLFDTFRKHANATKETQS